MTNGIKNTHLPISPNDVDDQSVDWYNLEEAPGLPASPNSYGKTISYVEHKYKHPISIPKTFTSLVGCDTDVLKSIAHDIYTNNIHRCNIVINDCKNYYEEQIIYLIAKGLSCENFSLDVCDECDCCYHFDYVDNVPYVPIYKFDYASDIDSINIRDFEHKYKPLSDNFKYIFLYIRHASNLHRQRVEKLTNLLNSTDKNILFFLSDSRFKDINHDLVNMSRIYDIRN